MRFRFDEWELKDRLQALEIALLRSGVRVGAYPHPKSTPCGGWPWVFYCFTFDLWALFLGVIQIIAAVRIGWEFKVMPLISLSGTLLLVYGTYGTYITSVCIQGGYSGSGACESPALRMLGILLLASGAWLVDCAFRLGHREKWRWGERG